MIRIIALAVTIVVLAGGAARALPAQPLSFYPSYSPVRQSPVEQYMNDFWGNFTFANPTTCAWDIDDNAEYVANGALAAGTSASWSLCQVYDAPPVPLPDTQTPCEARCGQPYGVLVTDASPDLQVLSCFSPPGRCFTSAPVFDKAQHAYLYALCLRIDYAYGDPNVQPVPGTPVSAVITNQSTTITNPTNKLIRTISARINQVGFYQSAGYCVYNAADTHLDYPFRWSP